MPPSKLARGATTPKLTRTRKNTETTLKDQKKNSESDLPVTTRPRRSPRKHGTLQTTMKEKLPAKRGKQFSSGTLKASKQNASVRDDRAHQPFPRAAVTSEAIIESSPRAGKKSNAAIQPRGRPPKRSKVADPALNLRSTRQLRPRSRPKPSTQFNHRIRRGPGRNASHTRGKHDHSKAEDPRRIPATRRSLRKKVCPQPEQDSSTVENALDLSIQSRPRLIQEGKPIFDFSVEESWSCLPMPTQLLWDVSKDSKSEARFLTQPKPDLAVCFQRQAVIPARVWRALPQSTRGLAVFEDRFAHGSRIFHFLAIEAKKAIFNLNSPYALYQSLNDASQALHNFFEFLRDAGPEHEQVFYNKVRFFSIVANREGILVRIHRAIKKPDDADPYELVIPDRPDYRLQFEFQVFQRISDVEDFSRKKILEVMRKIFKYARDDLFKMINAAASSLAQKLKDNIVQRRARVEGDFYSYGLPNPRNVKSSKGTRVLTSTIGEGVQQHLGRTGLGSNRLPSEHSTVNRQTTPKQFHRPATSSRISTISRKQGVDESGLDDPQQTQAIGPPVRKRGRPRGNP